MNSRYQQPSADLLVLATKSVSEVVQLNLELSWASDSSVRVIAPGYILDIEDGKSPVLYIRPTGFKADEEVHDFWVEWDLASSQFLWGDDIA